jgi:hypothetical protein
MVQIRQLAGTGLLLIIQQELAKRCKTSALSKTDPPILSKSDPGILN